MKNVIIVILFIAMTFQSYLICGNNIFTYKKDTVLYKNFIKIEPLGILCGSYTFSYERKISNRGSIDAHIGYRYNTGNFLFPFWYSEYSDSYKWDITGYAANFEYRHYLSSYKFLRFYISPNLRYCYLNETTKHNDGIICDQSVICSYAISAIGGYELVIKRFTFDIFIGPQLKYIMGYPSKEVALPWEDVDQQMIDLRHQKYLGIRFGISYGIAF